jgi:hypothetical protein
MIVSAFIRSNERGNAASVLGGKEDYGNIPNMMTPFGVPT